ncbi:class II D-tagatose-bisphosphate aldolase non-catalytic subunit, partial [Escherichia coli]|uniref:class II D-tagatose-bisphosphate aldolase non-catalytic subunit n=2 Tax=Pseudomonadota TaxID=1224 RepID=UPI0013D722FE|nr:class II D-tagatose-bisphosphate aldolase, non-catalytic subunit [Mycobacterium tuberculosis]
YHGADDALHVQRHYSYSDRIRYYWTEPEAMQAVSTLMAALAGRDIPETLLRQFLPDLAVHPADRSNPEAILIAAVDRVLADYS